MGAEQFRVEIQVKSIEDTAFERAQELSRYEHGHSGYTGTIAEKDTFILLEPIIENPDVSKIIEEFEQEHPHCTDYLKEVFGELKAEEAYVIYGSKWEPALAIAHGGFITFFGCASS